MMLRHMPLEPLVILVNLPFLVSLVSIIMSGLLSGKFRCRKKKVATLGTSGYKDGCEKKEILEKA